MLVFADAFVPAVRYVMLAIIVAVVGTFEGASGPVGMILLLFAVIGVVATLGCWLLAWVIATALSGFTPSTQRLITWVCLVAALLGSLWFDPYTTPFGRAPVGGLLEVLS
jgi:hypothetical protein